MKRFVIALFCAITLAFSSAAYSVEATGWRIIFEQSIENDTQIAVSEIEFLYDDDDDPQTPRVDATLADLGEAECGWTRDVSNLDVTGDGINDLQTNVPVPCDSVSTDRRRESTIVPTGTRRTRLGKLMFDDNFASEYKTRRVINPNNGTWTVQYMWYIGPAAPSRTLKDVDAYSLTVSNEYLGPSPDGLAPSIFQVDYRDPSTGRWVKVDEREAVNFNDGVDVDSMGRKEGDTGFTTAIAKKLYFVLP